jgi:hypothetical protein
MNGDSLARKRNQAGAVVLARRLDRAGEEPVRSGTAADEVSLIEFCRESDVGSLFLPILRNWNFRSGCENFINFVRNKRSHGMPFGENFL